MSNENLNLPDFIYGTAWKEDQTKPLTKLAIESGFRAIDTANQRKHYHEEGVGEALQEAITEGLVERDDIFLQTKFTHAAGQDHRMPYDPEDSLRTQVKDSLESSLDHLNTEYIDSLVLHGPSTRSGLSEGDREVWETFEELAKSERVQNIGVSNVQPGQLDQILSLSEIKPTFVQNRCFARTLWDQDTREICSSNGVHYQGFSLLTANERELRSEIIRNIAQKNDVTIPQVVFRFAVEVDMIPLTGTTDEDHMKQDLEIFDFSLTDEDVEKIENLAG